MYLFAVIAVAGIALGYLVGGRLRGLAELRLRGSWLLALAVMPLLASQVPGIAELAEEAPDSLFTVMSLVAVIAWLLLNARSQKGRLGLAFAAVLLGSLMNAAVIAANGGMPIPRHHYEASHHVEDLHVFGHVPISSGTALRPLADVIPIEPAARLVRLGVEGYLSAGDVVLAAGLMALIVLAMARSPRPQQAASLGLVPTEAQTLDWTHHTLSRQEAREEVAR